MIARFIIVLALIMAVDASVVLLLILRPNAISGAAVGAIAISVVPLVALAAFHLLWRPMLASFQWQQPSLDAERRRYQSFSIGIVNMGFSIHVAVDDDFLHLEPLWIWQVLGASPASIPWTAMKPARDGIFATPDRSVRVNGHTMVGPKWCLARVWDRRAA